METTMLFDLLLRNMADHHQIAVMALADDLMRDEKALHPREIFDSITGETYRVVVRDKVFVTYRRQEEGMILLLACCRRDRR